MMIKRFLKLATFMLLVVMLSVPMMTTHAQGGKGGKNKVTICHKGETKSVNQNALSAHLGHGDTEGACGANQDDEDDEDERTYSDLSGIVASYDATTGIIVLEDGTVLILYDDIDFDLAPGDEIVVRGYLLEDGHFLVIWITLEAELPETNDMPVLSIWIDLNGQVSGYDPDFGTFLLDDATIVILIGIDLEGLELEDGTLVEIHGELLPDGRVLATELEILDGEIDEDASFVTICHIPPGNTGNAHTITVGAAAVPAHLAHGDFEEACGEGESAVVITDNDLVIIVVDCEDACDSVLLIIADTYGVAYPDLVELQERGYDIVEISRFYIIATLAEVDVEEVITQYETAEHDWVLVFEQYPDLDPSVFLANNDLDDGRE